MYVYNVYVCRVCVCDMYVPCVRVFACVDLIYLKEHFLLVLQNVYMVLE